MFNFFKFVNCGRVFRYLDLNISQINTIESISKSLWNLPRKKCGANPNKSDEIVNGSNTR